MRKHDETRRPRDHHGSGGHEGHGGRGRRRAQRGDIRTAILMLLADRPMHGYQLMQAIGERTGSAWTPSPGAVYPTINQLEDEGLVTVTADAGRKLVALTDAGRSHLAEHRDAWGDPFAGYDATAAGADLRGPLHGLHGAARQVARAGSDEQRAAATQILEDARRALYLLLANGTQESSD
jgi:DNA-binding PadR family transcriptional regulator